uniref:SIR2-like domain-containing protein n=1 Tax=Candidatus Kentrum sp. MB TaxID=2138164 RepID=A0A450X0B2_9GAMM|nr:MAG: SIR2-like domain-containing protein [Candidatus Kentron sp. MB]
MATEIAAIGIRKDIEQVIKEIELERIVYFFGAGASAGAQGFPDGSALSEWLTERLWKKGKLPEEPPSVYQKTKDAYDSDLRLICDDLQLSSQLYQYLSLSKRRGLEEILTRCYGGVEKGGHRLSPPPIYKCIVRGIKRRIEQAENKRPPPLLLTTNFDNLLELALEEQSVAYDLLLYRRMNDPGRFSDFYYRENSLLESTNNFDDIERSTWRPKIPGKNPLVIKLHGCLQPVCKEGKPEVPLTITDQDYLSPALYTLYDAFPSAIRDKLSNNHWLFLGHSFKDLHIRLFLQHLHDSYDSGKNNKPKIFAITRGSNVQRILRISQEIHLIPCEMDRFVDELCGLEEEKEEPNT